EGGRGGRDLHLPARRIDVHQAGADDAERRDLRDREVDEDDALAQHLRAERHMGGEYQHTSAEGRREDREIDRRPVHFAASSRIATLLSKRPNKSPALALPPTV